MSTTVNKILGLAPSYVTVDEWGYDGPLKRAYLPYDKYEMVKLGRKEYGFRLIDDGCLEARYKCSYPEAQRRFKLMLITRKMLR